MSTHGSVFGAMLQEFDGAARLLNLEPGIWKILTHPKRQITVSCPVQMDNGEIEVFTGYRVQYNITLGPAKGRHPLSPGRHARRGDGAGRLDDVEVRGGAHPLRRRQGRHHLRSDAHVAARARGADAPLRRGNHRRHRPREGRPGARRQHQRADDGVGDGHLQHARRPHRNRASSPASRSNSADRSGRREATGRGVMIVDARVGQARRHRHQGRHGRRAGVRQRRIDQRRAPRRARAPGSSRSPTGKAASTTPRGWTSRSSASTSGSTRPSPASPAASRSPTTSSSASTSTS